MSFPLGRGAADSELQPLVDINTTPLIDVMLVLLVMLIITIPIQLHATNLNMPIPRPPPAVPVEPVVVRINIEANGAIRWNGDTLANQAELETRLAGLAAQADPPELHVRPDRAARYKVVAGVLAAVQRHHLTKIGLVGAEQFL